MPKTINVDLFWTKDALNKTPTPDVSAPDLARRYVENSRDRLKFYGFDLKTTPGATAPTDANTLPWPTTINLPEHDAHVRRMASGKRPNSTALTVVFATLNEASRTDLNKDGTSPEVLGWVPDEQVVLKDWKPFVFINVLRYTSVGYPLAHEIGHAAGLDHVKDSDNIMFFGAFFTATKFDDGQLKTIEKAYFVENT